MTGRRTPLDPAAVQHVHDPIELSADHRRQLFERSRRAERDVGPEHRLEPVPLGDAVLVNQWTTSSQWEPRIDLTPDGRDKANRYQVADRIIGTGPNTGKKFVECGIPDLSNARSAHAMLHPYVRRNGPEGDYHLLTPLEFHADTSELVQMLEKGHHNVQLDQEAWQRLYTWIDLNGPYHGRWSDVNAIPEDGHARRLADRQK
mgnify:CR=1 FL=1